MRVWWHGGKTPKARRDSTKEVKNLVKYHVGVDVGKNRHHVSIRDMSTDTYYKAFSISCDRAGFLKLVSALERLSTNKDDFIIGVEACGPYGVTLSYFLLSLGYKVVEINPFRASQFRKAEGKKAKTDRIDARSLALLIAFPGPESIIRAGEEKVAQSLSNASPGRMGKGMARIIVETARNIVEVSKRSVSPSSPNFPPLLLRREILAECPREANPQMC